MNDALISSEGMKENLINRKNVIILICSLILGILGDYLFFKNSLGVSYPLFVTVFYAIFLWNARSLLARKYVFGWFLMMPVLMLSASYFIFSNIMFAALNFLAVPVLIIAQTTLVTGGNRFKWHEAWFLSDILYGAVFRGIAYAFKPFSILGEFISRKSKTDKNNIVVKILVGIVVSGTILAVIIPVLASADKVFENLVGFIPEYLSRIGFSEYIMQAVLIFVIFIATFSYIWSFVNAKAENRNIDSLIPKISLRVIDPVTVITVLLSINIIYVIFVAIQFAYLFGGIVPEGLTYSEYARKGFFELNFVTMVNLSILLCNVNMVKDAGRTANIISKVLNTTLIICTMVMLASAHYRMWMYEEEYGYTYLRILTHSFMAFLFVLLLVTLIKLWSVKFPLLKAYIIIAVTSFVIVNYVNIDVVIARKNIERYRATGNIDVSYLTNLSYDAVPLMTGLLNDKNPEVAIRIENHLYNVKNRLSKENNWQSFSVSKYFAKNELAKYNLEYKEYKERY